MYNIYILNSKTFDLVVSFVPSKILLNYIIIYTHTTSYLVYTGPVQSAQLQKLNLPFLDCCCLKFFLFSFCCDKK